jgi:hypothetical protein
VNLGRSGNPSLLHAAARRGRRKAAGVNGRDQAVVQAVVHRGTRHEFASMANTARLTVLPLAIRPLSGGKTVRIAACADMAVRPIYS